MNGKFRACVKLTSDSWCKIPKTAVALLPIAVAMLLLLVLLLPQYIPVTVVVPLGDGTSGLDLTLTGQPDFSSTSIVTNHRVRIETKAAPGGVAAATS